MTQHADQTLPTPAAADPPAHGEGEIHVHIVKPGLLFLVFIALLFLTFLTVAVTHFDFGRTANVWVALGIAVAKGSLVALFFMHLRWDSPFHSLVFVTALFFVALFIGLTVLDTKEAMINYTLPANSARPVVEQ